MKASAPEEIPLSQNLIEVTYGAVDGEAVVLVGGQALSFWMYRYDISDQGLPFVTRDVDFLAEGPCATSIVVKIAKAIGGQSVIPRQAAITSLVGQAVVFLNQEKTKIHNVDVIFQLIGVNETDVKKKAIEFDLPTSTRPTVLKVMHPEHVLLSRFFNFTTLQEKQTPMGLSQLKASIQVLRSFCHDQASLTKGGLSQVNDTYSRLLKTAGTKKAMRLSRDHGVHLMDCVDLTLFPAEHPFLLQQASRALALMSPECRAMHTPANTRAPKKGNTL